MIEDLLSTNVYSPKVEERERLEQVEIPSYSEISKYLRVKDGVLQVRNGYIGWADHYNYHKPTYSIQGAYGGYVNISFTKIDEYTTSCYFSPSQSGEYLLKFDVFEEWGHSTPFTVEYNHMSYGSPTMTILDVASCDIPFYRSSLHKMGVTSYYISLKGEDWDDLTGEFIFNTNNSDRRLLDVKISILDRIYYTG